MNESRCSRGQESALHPWQFLQRHSKIRLARVNLSASSKRKFKRLGFREASVGQDRPAATRSLERSGTHHVQNSGAHHVQNEAI